MLTETLYSPSPWATAWENDADRVWTSTPDAGAGVDVDPTGDAVGMAEVGGTGAVPASWVTWSGAAGMVAVTPGADAGGRSPDPVVAGGVTDGRSGPSATVPTNVAAPPAVKVADADVGAAGVGDWAPEAAGALPAAGTVVATPALARPSGVDTPSADSPLPLVEFINFSGSATRGVSSDSGSRPVPPFVGADSPDPLTSAPGAGGPAS